MTENQVSFSHTVKTDLAGMPTKKMCCRRALLQGLLLGARCEGEQITASFSHEEVSRLFGTLVREVYHREATVQEGMTVGRKTYTHTFFSPKAQAFLESLAEASLLQTIDSPQKCCSPSFLRGAFLALGTVADPVRTFHAELMVPDAARATRLAEYMTELGIPPRRRQQTGRVGLYYKNSTAVEELFAGMGASSLVFQLINTKIEKNIRNQENRATNCVARNISRTVDTVARQIAAIERLREHGMLEGLSQDLVATAMLRLRMDEASLAELAAAHTPPISKSGLNHRLTKLLELAEKIK